MLPAATCSTRCVTWSTIPVIARDAALRAAPHSRTAGALQFPVDPDLDATNWRAEQALPPAVITRQVCGGAIGLSAGPTRNRFSPPFCAPRTSVASIRPTCLTTLLRARAPIVSPHFYPTTVSATLSNRAIERVRITVRLAKTKTRVHDLLAPFRSGWRSPVQPVQCGAATLANMARVAIESLYVYESKGLPRDRIPLSPPTVNICI